MILSGRKYGLQAALALAALVALAAGSLGCTSGAAPRDAEVESRAQRGGTAVLGSISDVDSWNEYTSQQSFAGNLLRRIYLGLAREIVGPHSQPYDFEPLLAESWASSDDGLSLTFLLREASWSDGQPVTADDVRFTWQAQTDPSVPWVGAGSKQHITDVEVLGPRRVRFHFDARYPFQLADAVEGGIVPEHVFGRVPFEQWATHDWSQSTVGSGPFILERHVPQQEIRLARNPYYFEDGLPLLDSVVVRVVPDSVALLTLLETGEIDWIDGVPPGDAQRLERGAGGRVTLIAYDYPNYDFIGWNTARPPLDSAELRRALTLAIDREALVEDMLYGYGVVARTPVPSTWWGADRSITALPYDPAQASAILTRLGYGGGPQTASPLRLEIVTNNGNRLRRDMLVKIQQQLARVGVEVQIRALEPKAMRQQVSSGDFDGFLGGWVFVGRVDLAALFGSESVPPHGLNVVRYACPEVDRELGALERAPDARAMATPLRHIQAQLVADQPYTLLYESRRIVAHRRRLHGVVIDVVSDPLARLERFWVDPR